MFQHEQISNRPNQASDDTFLAHQPSVCLEQYMDTLFNSADFPLLSHAEAFLCGGY